MVRRLWVLAGVGCSGEQPPEDEPIDFAAPGPYRVGYREESVDWVEPITGELRTLPLAVWYPTEEESGLPVTYQGLFPAEGVLGDAPPAFPAERIVVFSHGHQGYAQSSSFLMTHFASHGWWVYAPDHVGNTTFDGPDRETAIYWQRPLDLSAVLDDGLMGLPTIIMGHSFGGYTAHAIGSARYDIDTLAPGCEDGSDDSPFCSTMTPEQEDLFRVGFARDGIAAMISMAPGDWRLFGDGLAEIGVPVMLMTGGLDPGTDGDPIWSDLDHPDDVRVHLPDAGHNAFTDFSGVLDGEGAIDPETGFSLISARALAFAEAWTSGDREAIAFIYGGGADSPDALPSFR